MPVINTFGNFIIRGVAEPGMDNDAANRAYVLDRIAASGRTSFLNWTGVAPIIPLDVYRFMEENFLYIGPEATDFVSGTAYTAGSAALFNDDLYQALSDVDSAAFAPIAVDFFGTWMLVDSNIASGQIQSPGGGDIVLTTGAAATISFNNTDADGVDHSADLTTLTAGDVLNVYDTSGDLVVVLTFSSYLVGDTNAPRYISDRDVTLTTGTSYSLRWGGDGLWNNIGPAEPDALSLLWEIVGSGAGGGVQSYSDAEQATAIAVGNIEEGTIWYNTDDSTVKYYTGTLIETLADTGITDELESDITTVNTNINARIDALPVPAITEEIEQSQGPGSFILTNAQLTSRADLLGRYAEGLLRLEASASTQRTSNNIDDGVTLPGTIDLVIRNNGGMDVIVIEGALTIGADGNIAEQVTNIDIDALAAAQDLHFNFRFPLGTTGIQYGWSDFQITLGRVSEIDEFLRVVLRDELDVTTVVANPDGTDGDSLTRISVDGTNFNLAGGVEVLDADPDSPTEGLAWYNTDDDVIRYYDGTDTQTVVDHSYYNENTGITVHHAVSGTAVNADFSGTSGNTRAGTIAIVTPGDYTIAATIQIDSFLGSYAQGQWRVTLAGTEGVVVSRNITVNTDQVTVTKNLVADGLTAQTYTLTATLTDHNNVQNWTVSARAEDNDHDSIDVDPLVYEDLDARYVQPEVLGDYPGVTDFNSFTIPINFEGEWTPLAILRSNLPTLFEDIPEAIVTPSEAATSSTGFARFTQVVNSYGSGAAVADQIQTVLDDEVAFAATNFTADVIYRSLTGQLVFYVARESEIADAISGERFDLLVNGSAFVSLPDLSTEPFVIHTTETIGVGSNTFTRIVADSSRDWRLLNVTAERAADLQHAIDNGVNVERIISGGEARTKFQATASAADVRTAFLASYNLHTTFSRFSIPLRIRAEEYDLADSDGNIYTENPVPRYVTDNLQTAISQGTSSVTHLGDLVDVDNAVDAITEKMDPADTTDDTVLSEASASNSIALQLERQGSSSAELQVLVDRQSTFQDFESLVEDSLVHVVLGSNANAATEFFTLTQIAQNIEVDMPQLLSNLATADADGVIVIDIPEDQQPAISVQNIIGTYTPTTGSEQDGVTLPFVFDEAAQTITITLVDGANVEARAIAGEITYVDSVLLTGTPTQALINGILSTTGVVSRSVTTDLLGTITFSTLTATQIGDGNISALEDDVEYTLPSGHFWGATSITDEATSVFPRSEHDALVTRVTTVETSDTALSTALDFDGTNIGAPSVSGLDIRADATDADLVHSTTDVNFGTNSLAAGENYALSLSSPEGTSLGGFTGLEFVNPLPIALTATEIAEAFAAEINAGIADRVFGLHLQVSNATSNGTVLTVHWISGGAERASPQDVVRHNNADLTGVTFTFTQASANFENLPDFFLSTQGTYYLGGSPIGTVNVHDENAIDEIIATYNTANDIATTDDIRTDGQINTLIDNRVALQGPGLLTQNRLDAARLATDPAIEITTAATAATQDVPFIVSFTNTPMSDTALATVDIVSNDITAARSAIFTVGVDITIRLQGLDGLQRINCQIINEFGVVLAAFAPQDVMDTAGVNVVDERVQQAVTFAAPVNTEMRLSMTTFAVSSASSGGIVNSGTVYIRENVSVVDTYQAGSLSELTAGDIATADANGDAIAATQDQVNDAIGLSGTGSADTRIDSRATVVVSSASVDLLSDVDTTTRAPANGQALTWNSTAGQWEPLAISGGTINTNIVLGNGELERDYQALAGYEYKSVMNVATATADASNYDYTIIFSRQLSTAPFTYEEAPDITGFNVSIADARTAYGVASAAGAITTYTYTEA